MKNTRTKLATAALLAVGLVSLAQAQVQINGSGPDALTGNTTDPSNWRFTPGQNIGGVNGLLDGVARLRFTTNAGETYACSGSLLAGGQYVLTAAHCADDFKSMTVKFGFVNGTHTEMRNVSVGNAFIHHGWTASGGNLSAGADIAILKLDTAVTSIKGYELSTTNDLGKVHLMAGYGTTQRGDVNAPTDWSDGGYGHYAFNTFDVDEKTFRSTVANAFNAPWFSPAVSGKYGMVYMADFDNGDPNYNSLQGWSDATNGSWKSDNGLGSLEGLIAGGDSGGGDFVWINGQWKLSGVHSWGWQPCSACDYAKLNRSSYSDLSGSTAVFSHINWINSVMTAPVPEPETYALMLAGLGAIGAVARRRKQQA